MRPEDDPILRSLCEAFDAGESVGLALRDRLTELGFPAAAYDHFVDRPGRWPCFPGQNCTIVAAVLGVAEIDSLDSLEKIEAESQFDLGPDWKDKVYPRGKSC